ncbi:unnamed protein product, partial [Owenia fusiformis]
MINIWLVLLGLTVTGQAVVEALRTPDDEGFRHVPLTVSDRTFLAFSVKACHDAILDLQLTPGSTVDDSYEVVLDGFHPGHKSVIRDDERTNQMAHKDGAILSCNEFNDFWVSWANGNIEVGTGKVKGSGRFMSWTDTTPHAVNAINVYTGWGATGEWKFYDLTRMNIQTPNDESYRHQALDVSDQTFLAFSVKACH